MVKDFLLQRKVKRMTLAGQSPAKADAEIDEAITRATASLVIPKL